jgi:homoserine kinase
MALVREARGLGALGATISGAGPSVLVWTSADTAAEVAARLKPGAAGWARVLPLPFAATGADVD